MKRSTKVGLTIVGILTVIVIGFFIYTKTAGPTIYKEYLSASWMYGYKDVPELTKNSDAIALVRVEGIDHSREEIISSTFFKVSVKEAMLGCKEGEELIIYMTGGYKDKNKNIISELKDDPLMEEGQEFLIFTQRNEDGTYTTLGGPQGRLLYQDGKLNSLKYTSLPHVNLTEASVEKYVDDECVNVKDEKLETIRKQIEEAL